MESRNPIFTPRSFSEQPSKPSQLVVEETVELASAVFGELSSNWDNVRGATCGSNGS